MDAEELDWPAEPVAQLEESLRCKICHDLFTGPVTLPCSHSYCSQCIRSNFDFKIREGHKVACPECRAVLDPADLRLSFALRDACKLFRACKPMLLQALHAQSLQQSAPSLQQKAGQQHDRPAQQRQQQQQPSRRLTRRLSNEQQQQQQQQQQLLSHGYHTSDAGPNCSRPHSDPTALQRTRIRSSSRTQPRSSSSPPGLQAAAAVDGSDEEEAVSGSQDSEEEGSDADSEFTPSSAAKRRRTGDPSGKENVAATPLAQPQEGAAAGQQRRQRLSNSSSGNGAAEPAAAAKPGKPGEHEYGQCPVCNISVHLKFIETHVNACITKQDQQEQQQRQQTSLEDDFAAPRAGRGSSRAGGQHASAPAALAPAAQNGRAVTACPLPPKLCFNMMNVREVKERLSALGLPVDAKPKLTKEAMVQRYQAFRTFVQSLTDSGRLLSQEQAVAEFSKQLKQQQRAAAKQQLMAPAAAAAATGNNSFDELIKQTRARQQQEQQAASKQQHPQQQQQSQPGHGARAPASHHHGVAAAVVLHRQQRPHSSTPHADVAMDCADHEANGLSVGHESGTEGSSEQDVERDDRHAQATASCALAAQGNAAHLGEWAGQQQPQQQWRSGMHSCAYQQAVLDAHQQEHPIIIEDSEPDD